MSEAEEPAPTVGPAKVFSLLLPLALIMAATQVVLVAAEALDPLAAAGGFLLFLALAYPLVRRHLAALDAVKGFADRLTAGPAPLPRAARLTGITRELGGAVARLERELRDRADEQQMLARTWQTILDSVPDPLLTLDQHGRVVRANLAARRVLGKAVEGRDVSQVLRHPPVFDAVEAVLAGAPGRSVDLTLLQPVRRDFSLHAHPLPARAPDGTSLLIVMHDVTTLRRAEQMRGDFVANASHELRTPLASLIGFIETLRGPARDDEDARDRFLAIMQDQALRMSRLIDDLLSLSRIELNEHTPPTATVDLGELLQSTAAALELQADRRKMRIDLEVGAAPLLATGDADELAQVFQNLLDNAIKYGREGSRIGISARPAERLPAAFPRAPGGAVSVAVRDRGEGIAAVHLPRLTERFYRADPARAKLVGGTGLGLAIVKHILNRHRGTLTIESEIGQGSIFTVYLPAAGDPRRQAPQPPRERPGSPS